MNRDSARLRCSQQAQPANCRPKGAAFSELLDDVRREHASALLRDPNLSIDEIAERMGYADTSNFTRAFRRWTGKNPAAFRKG